MKLAWLTDLHFNFCSSQQREAFVNSVAAEQPDAVLLGGDIGEADTTADLLERLARCWQVPVYFVLGNHDFYHGSIAAVRAEATRLAERVPNLTYLSASAAVRLSDGTALVGVDGWGDGGFGLATTSPIRLNDFRLIEELREAAPGAPRLEVLRQLGKESKRLLRGKLGPALATSERIIVLTHVPPFEEAAWHEGKVSDDDWLPWFACRATGEILRDAMAAHPDKRMLVLCGHTHGAGECQILPNLRVLTGGAEYGRPRVQRMIEAPDGSPSAFPGES